MKIVDAVWFTPVGAVIGIVTVRNESGEIKQYIGFGKGKDEEEDANFIARHGAPFHASFIYESFMSTKKAWKKL